MFFFTSIIISYIQHIHILHGNVWFSISKIKASKVVLKFCNDFIFFDYYSIERVIEIKYFRDFKIVILSIGDFVLEDNGFNVSGVIDDKLVMVINKQFEKIGREINNITVGVLQRLRLERLYKKQFEKWSC